VCAERAGLEWWAGGVVNLPWEEKAVPSLGVVALVSPSFLFWVQNMKQRGQEGEAHDLPMICCSWVWSSLMGGARGGERRLACFAWALALVWIGWLVWRARGLFIICVCFCVCVAILCWELLGGSRTRGEEMCVLMWRTWVVNQCLAPTPLTSGTPKQHTLSCFASALPPLTRSCCANHTH